MEFLRPLADAEYPGASASSGASATTVATWNPGPQGVLVWSTQDVYVKVGVGAVATATSTPVPAYTPIPFHAPQTGSGSPWSVSVLQITTAGTVYAKPINIR
jgi:hypothetical protein